MYLLALFVKYLRVKGSCMNNKIWLSVEELAARWGVLPRWVYSNHKKIGLPSRKIGGHLRFPLSEIEGWEGSQPS